MNDYLNEHCIKWSPESHFENNDQAKNWKLTSLRSRLVSDNPYICHVTCLDQSEASIQVMWPALTNQRPVSLLLSVLSNHFASCQMCWGLASPANLNPIIFKLVIKAKWIILNVLLEQVTWQSVLGSVLLRAEREPRTSLQFDSGR